MPSSDEYWSIDGVSLHEYGWSVATVGGSRYDLPPRRGEDIVYAYRPGKVHRSKPADARTVELVMWTTGVDPTTGDATTDARLAWNDNWDTLRRLVWRPGGSQVTLTRRWWLTIDGTPTLVAADAQAEITDTMAPTMTGRTRADFTMSLLLADPYFYGDEVTASIPVAGSATLLNPGHDLAANGVQIDLVGPLTNPQVTNNSTAPAVWVKYTGDVAAGQILRLDAGNFTASLVTAGTTSTGSTTAILSLVNGLYVTAESAGSSPLIANRLNASTWETFDIIDAGSGLIALRSHANNLYVTAETAGEQPLIANRTVIGPWEQFQLLANPDGTQSLRANANGLYVTAEAAGAQPLIANRTAIGPWEKFQFTDPAFAVANMLGAITHGGSRAWMGMLPGSNTLTLSGSGTGSALVRFRPPYV